MGLQASYTLIRSSKLTRESFKIKKSKEFSASELVNLSSAHSSNVVTNLKIHTK